MSISLAAATAVELQPDGSVAVELADDWAVGGNPHGGYLMALLARAGVTALGGDLDPLALSTEFLRVAKEGPATVRTEVRKTGRTASVIGLTLEQGGRDCVTGTLTAGTLPGADPEWVDLPDFPAEPEPDGLAIGATAEGPSKIAENTGLVMSRRNAGVYTGERRKGDPLLLRGWAKLPDADPDPYFGLVIGDVMPPLVFNLGHFAWAPTVQLTALLRARPVPGWLRVQVESRWVAGGWFDSDATVLDAAGRLICQGRQLALVGRT